MSLQSRGRHAKRRKVNSGLPILRPCGRKTEDSQRFSAAARTITSQQEGSKVFMTSGEEKLTLSEASNCLRVRTLTSWRPYRGHDDSGASVGGAGGIQTQHSRTKGQHFFY